eukprot:4804720-Alexandrium_andersonii.AAC.1
MCIRDRAAPPAVCPRGIHLPFLDPPSHHSLANTHRSKVLRWGGLPPFLALLLGTCSASGLTGGANAPRTTPKKCFRRTSG